MIALPYELLFIVERTGFTRLLLVINYEAGLTLPKKKNVLNFIIRYLSAIRYPAR